MSDTIVDMAKVTQALDAGWHLELYKGGMGSYVVIAKGNDQQMRRLADTQLAWCVANPEHEEFAPFIDGDGDCVTDDFTPEQALTRAAYKVQGEIL